MRIRSTFPISLRPPSANSWFAAMALVTTALLVSGPAAASGITGCGKEISTETCNELQDAISTRVGKLLAEKNSDGFAFKRAQTSNDFKKVDDATYATSFYVDSATPETMLTERFLMTLKRSANGKSWSIASEDLQDSYKGLSRPLYTGKDFSSFGTFHFEREGMRITASNGNIFEVKRDGKTEEILLTADDIAYDYLPPMPLDRSLYPRVKKRYAEDLIFKPQQVYINCDAVSCQDLLVQGTKNAQGEATLKPVDEGAVSATMTKLHQKLVDDDKDQKKGDYFSGFGLPYKPDHRFWSLAVLDDSESRRVAINYNNHDAREVSYSAYGLFETFPFWQTMYSYYSEATRNSGQDPYALETRDSGLARYYDLEGLVGTVELGLDDPELLRADITYTINMKLPAKELYFRISRNFNDESVARQAKNPSMRVITVEDTQGNPLTFAKTGPSQGLIILPKEAPAGSQVVVHIVFENKNSIYKLNSSYSAMDRGGWLPFVEFTDRIKKFDLTVKVPGEYTTLGIGKVVSDEVKDGVRTTRFFPDGADVTFPTVIFGDYYMAESKIKVTKPDGTVVPVRCYADKIGINEGMYLDYDEFLRGIKHEATPKSMPALADEAANALNLYSEIFGVPYMYNKLDLVNDPLGFLYGQSPASLIYLGQGAFLSKGVLGNMGGSNATKFSKSLVAHETAHQWWGSLISNANDWNYWFVESLAEYSSALFVEVVHGKKEYYEHVDDWKRRIEESELEVPVVGANEMWGGGYQALVYAKGPYIFHVMRMTWGDEKFFKFLKDLAQSLAGKPIVTRDIQKIAERNFGGNMDWFFDQWLRGVGIPDYTVNYTSRQAENGKWVVQGTVDQKVVMGPKKEVIPDRYYVAVIPFTVTGASGKTYRIPLKIEGKTTQINFPLPEQPKSIEFNKYGEALSYDSVKGS